MLSKNIGTNIRVKFTEETPFSGQIISMNIKQLEAENGQSEKKMSSISAWSSPKSVDRALLNGEHFLSSFS